VVPYLRLAKVVLDRWREVELRLEALPPDSHEADELRDEIYRLREEYQHLIEAAVAHHRPVPPPMPDEPEGTA
jgi:hypothetical protein